mgnify:CR=1 FL=1
MPQFTTSQSVEVTESHPVNLYVRESRKNPDTIVVGVEINDDVVPRERHATRTIQDGDRIEVVTLVNGPTA